MAEKSKEKTSVVSPIVELTAEIQLGEKTYKINKLRAGKFYEAQKVFMEIMKAAAPTAPTKKGTKELEIDVNAAMDNMFGKWPKLVAQFVTICVNKENMTLANLLEEAYPEQISDAFGVCLKLNNVFENLKKSAAPIGELGALEVKAK